MINYELTERGNFTVEDFNKKIKKVLLTISENQKKQKLIFKEVRHTYNQEYKISNEEFCGTYITIQISSKEKVLGYINCFFDNKNGFIEFSTSGTHNY